MTVIAYNEQSSPAFYSFDRVNLTEGVNEKDERVYSSKKKLIVLGITTFSLFMCITLIYTMISVIKGQNLRSKNNFEKFEEYIKKYNKKYTSQEYNYRLQIFSENYDYIQSTNQKGDRPYVLGVNKFADQTTDEFYKNFPNLHNTDAELMKQGELTNFEDFDEIKEIIYYTLNIDEFVINKNDFREAGVVTPVKDQMICGSCWAFSAVGAFETAYMMKHPEEGAVDFSEQELVDCLGYDGCNGGSYIAAFLYMTIFGISNEEDYPYFGQYSEQCDSSKDDTKHDLFGLLPIKPESTEALTVASAFSPVSVAVSVYGLDWMFYESGVLSLECQSDQLNHAVLVVGFEFPEDDSIPYYIVKNSWGQEWGDEGYLKIAIQPTEEGTVCINTLPVIPIVTTASL